MKVKNLFFNAMLAGILLAGVGNLKADWIKYSGNPVVPTYSFTACVILDEGTYRMWYLAGDINHEEIYYRESSDGIAWGSPVMVLAHPVGSIGMQSVEVLKEENVWKMWYWMDGVIWYTSSPTYNSFPQGQSLPTIPNLGAIVKNGSEYWGWFFADPNIKRATSPDGITWTADSSPALSPTPGSWDNDYVNSGHVVHADQWYLFYVGDHGFENDRIGVATSQDGLSWVKDPTNPIIPPGPSGSWDQHVTSLGSALYNGSFWQMWYTGNVGSGGSGNAIGYAHSLPGTLVHIGDHFCLDLVPGIETFVHWCCPLDGPPVFSFSPGCSYQQPGCDEVCPPYTGQLPLVWSAQFEGSNANCPLPGGWWSARFIAEGEGCVCVYFEDQLAVELTGFEAVALLEGIELRWRTASENGNDHFRLYRRSDDAEWIQIGVVPGQGTSSTAHDYFFLDDRARNGVTYRYRLAAVDMSGAFEWTGDIVTATAGTSNLSPRAYALEQNYPNPFNPSTEISFELPETGFVALNVFNVTGQKVAELVRDVRDAGRHYVVFDASSSPSGLYFYTLTANGFSATKKMLLIK
jgi:hypothetical protein